MKLWGGRFAPHSRDPQFEKFSESLSVDRRLILYDLRVNAAYIRALGRARVLSRGEVRLLIRGLKALRGHVEGHPNWAKGSSSEDVHAWVEERLEAHSGALARKLRTGRSRNDLVATETRMYVKDSVTRLELAAVELMDALVRQARRHPKQVLPGYTHLQPAQPVLFAHYLLAYFEMLRRDIERWEDCRKRADELPLGAGALAGNSFGIDRKRLAVELGFARVARNSLDVTSDRDFVCEVLFACALTLVHLSRLAEDLVIYSTPSFGYVEIAEAYSTGSSLMPQKKNPDSLELIRGKAARVLGDLSAMVALLKGLPLAYNRDLQEDKPVLFDGLDTTCESLTLAARIVRTLRLHPGRIERAMAEGFLTATDLAEALARRGVPFARAHEQVGKLVQACSARGISFAGLPAGEARRWVPSWDEGLRAIAVSPEIAVRRKNVVGGTAPARVAEQMREAEAALLRLKRTLARRPWMKGDMD